MRVIMLTTRAGGVGKTTVAVNLAAIWAQRGRTLLIDTDEQADASTALGVEDTGEALGRALTGHTLLTTAIRTTECGVDLAPGGEALSRIADRLEPYALSRALAIARVREYETVVIDCPPALRQIVISAWRSAPAAQAIVPVDGPKALRGVARLRNAWEDAGLDLENVRIALVRHNPRRLLDRELARQARDLYGRAVLDATVRESVIVSESAAWRQPLLLHAPTHAITGDLRRVAEEVAHG